jgi:hypothetical protein
MKTIAPCCRRLGLALAVLLALAACSTPPAIPGASPDLLKFLQDGTTTREQIVLALGQPSAAYEQEKILTYRIGQNPVQGYYLVAPNQVRQWEEVHFSLVLIVDASGTLRKHSLVSIQ